MKNTSDSNMTYKIGLILGALLVLAGVSTLAVDAYRSELFNTAQWKTIASEILCVVMIIIGILILRSRKHNIMRAVGLTSMLVAANDLISTVWVILPFLKNPSNILSFIILGVFIIIGTIDVFIILFAIRYMLGHRRNALRISICMMIPEILFVIGVIFGLSLYWSNWGAFIETFGQYVPMILIYGVLIIVLLLPSVREEITEWKVYKISNNAYESINIDPESSIYRKDLLGFLDILKHEEKWKDSELVPDARECTLEFGTVTGYILTVRKMKGSDVFRLSIIPMETKEYTQYAKFDLDTVVPRDGTLETCSMVRFYGFNGIYIDIRVRNDNPTPKRGFAVDRTFGKIRKKLSMH